MKTDIAQSANGYWMPAAEADGKRAERYRVRARELSTLLSLMPADRRRLAIQAGGHVGHYPRWLASRFARVITAEPHLANFAALQRNLTDDNILPLAVALGSQSSADAYRLVEHGHNSGGHHVRAGGDAGEAVRSLALDDMIGDPVVDYVREVDAIVLDVEGAELEVIRGARQLIEHARPWLQLEQRGHIEGKVGADTTQDLERELEALGYEAAARVGHDVIWRPL